MRVRSLLKKRRSFELRNSIGQFLVGLPTDPPPSKNSHGNASEKPSLATARHTT
jgi:hypothetical protein